MALTRMLLVLCAIHHGSDTYLPVLCALNFRRLWHVSCAGTMCNPPSWTWGGSDTYLPVLCAIHLAELEAALTCILCRYYVQSTYGWSLHNIYPTFSHFGCVVPSVFLWPFLEIRLANGKLKFKATHSIRQVTSNFLRFIPNLLNTIFEDRFGNIYFSTTLVSVRTGTTL